MVFEAYLMALAIDLVVVENPEKLRRMRPLYKQRSEMHVRTNHKIGNHVLSRAMSELGRKRQDDLRASGLQAYFSSIGGRSRAQSLSPSRRKAIARKAARVRWATHVEATA